MTSEIMSACASRHHLHWSAIKALISLVSIRVLLYDPSTMMPTERCVQDCVYCSHTEPGLISLQSSMLSAEVYNGSGGGGGMKVQLNFLYL